MVYFFLRINGSDIFFPGICKGNTMFIGPRIESTFLGQINVFLNSRSAIVQTDSFLEFSSLHIIQMLIIFLNFCWDTVMLYNKQDCNL